MGTRKTSITSSHIEKSYMLLIYHEKKTYNYWSVKKNTCAKIKIWKNFHIFLITHIFQSLHHMDIRPLLLWFLERKDWALKLGHISIKFCLFKCECLICNPVYEIKYIYLSIGHKGITSRDVRVQISIEASIVRQSWTHL